MMFGFKRFFRRVFRVDADTPRPPPRPLHRYGMSDTLGLMKAGAGFVSKSRRHIGGLPEDEVEFIRDMVSSSRRAGVNPVLAKSPLESERAEFHHAIPKILEVRAFELGLMP